MSTEESQTTVINFVGDARKLVALAERIEEMIPVMKNKEPEEEVVLTRSACDLQRLRKSGEQVLRLVASRLDILLIQADAVMDDFTEMGVHTEGSRALAAIVKKMRPGTYVDIETSAVPPKTVPRDDRTGKWAGNSMD